MKKNALWLFVLFTCWQINAQVNLVENFNSGTALPAGWTEVGGKTISATESCQGNSIRDNLYNSSTTGNLISPNQVAVSNGTDLTFSFDYKIENWNTTTAVAPGWGNFTVDYSTDNGVTWTTFFTVNDSNHVTANTCANFTSIIPATSLPAGSDVRFRFNIMWTAGDWDLYLDNISATQVSSTLPTCTTLTSPANGAVNITSGLIYWSVPSGVPTGYFLTVGTTSGDSDVLNSFDVGNVTSYNLGTLAAGTTYYTTIVPYNLNGNTTGCTETIFTSCDAMIAPWIYDVEAASATINSTINDCWSSIPTVTTASFRWDVDATGSTPSGSTGPSGAFSGTKYFYTEASSGSTGAVAELYTPMVNISALTEPTLQFYYHMYGANMGELHIDVFNGSNWVNDVDVIIGQQQATETDSWLQRIIDLSSYSGTIQVRFRGIRGTDFEGDISLDDISFVEVPACLPVTGLTVSNITSSSVQLDWNDMSNVGQFDFEYTIQVQGTGTPTSIGVPLADVTTVIATNDIATNPLLPNSPYEVYVRANCGGGLYSSWVGPINFTTPCNPYTIPYFEGFESGYVHNTPVSGCSSQATVTGTSVWTANNTLTTYNRLPRTGAWNAFLQYGNEDWLFIPIQMTGGTMYTFEGYARQDGGTATNSNILISYGTANTATAMVNPIVASTGIINGDYQLITGTFTPAVTGIYYVGIKGFMNSTPWYISLDDISITETPFCPKPLGLTASAVTNSSATFTWTATTGNYEYVLDNDAAEPTGAGTTLAGETYNTITLSPSTTYYFHVRSDCGSIWSTVSFTTAANPPANDNLCNAIPLTVDAVSTGTTFTNVAATAETGEPTGTCFNGRINGSVWFSFVAPASGQVIITTDIAGATLIDTEIALYNATGVTCSDLTTLGAALICDQDGGTTINYNSAINQAGLTPGNTYYIQVDRWGTATNGDFGIEVQQVLSSDNFDNNRFVAYPNPVKNTFNVSYISEISSVRVINLLGQEVISKNVNTTSTQVDMSQLTAGTYIVNVTVGDAIKTIKVVKQ